MSSILIHGDNQILSRQYLQELKQHALNINAEVITLEGRQTSLTEILEALETQSLFGENRLVVIENLFQNPSKVMVKSIVNYLSHYSSRTVNLVLWSVKLLTPSQLKQFVSWEIKTYKSSPVIFNFLENLAPHNQAKFMPLFNEACAKDSAEFVFFMLARQIRQLLAVSDLSFKAPPFIIAKLKKQSRLFSEPLLIKLHDALTDLDYRSKTGQIVGSLASELAYLLAKL